MAIERNKTKAVDIAGKDAATLSAVEIGLGSILHALKVPLAGQLLSLNQSFLLSRTVLKTRDLEKAKFLPFIISNITACLKSLSPAGKRLTPMLAISTQGFLFNLGTLLLGRNLIGLSLGAVLLSLWSYVQPVALYLLLFGKNLIDVIDYFLEKLQLVFHFNPSQLFYVLLCMILLKAILSIATVFLAFKISDQKFNEYKKHVLQKGRQKLKKHQSQIEQHQQQNSLSKKAMLALKDLFNPLFLISFLLMLVFFFFVKTDWTQVIWLGLRPIAMGFILFFLIRVLPLEKLLQHTENSRFKTFSKAFRIAIEQLKQL